VATNAHTFLVELILSHTHNAGMAISLLVCGVRHNPLRTVTQPRRRSGVTLLELIIVLAIIGLMASLLFPALQAARGKANDVLGENSVGQLGLALQQYIDTMKRLPAKGRWTIDILPWIEEKPLAEQIANGIPPNTLPRPALYRCDDQPEVQSTVPNVLVCHYILAVNRSSRPMKPELTTWYISDRPKLKDDEKCDPWYVGTEMSLNDQRLMFERKEGPHPGNLYYLIYNNGGVQTVKGP
jgi:prepilin-type N-terminal cleavage/methylation domain-containing protein